MQRRSVLRILGGGLMTAPAWGGLSACSSALPPQALAAWQAVTDLPVGDDPRRWMLAHAILAPHSHNLQSWLVDLREPQAMTLHCDLTRLLPETDPYSRQMMMSQGTFLELFALAAQQQGHRAEVRLFPEGEPGSSTLDSRPTAHVRLIRDASLRPDPLFAQIVHRHTNREQYDARAPEPRAVAAVLESMASFTGLRSGVVGEADAAQREQHRTLAMRAWQIELETPRTLLESYRWLRVGPTEIAEHRDGISLNSPFVRAMSALGLFDRSKAPPPGDKAIASQISSFNDKLRTTPAFFYMVTADNRRSTQVNAGRAYVRVQLAATAQGLSMHPLQQALQEYPEQASNHAEIHRLLAAQGPQATVQMWARLGYGPTIAPAPRRGVEAHLIHAVG